MLLFDNDYKLHFAGEKVNRCSQLNIQFNIYVSTFCPPL